jgi:2-C-methyl-D-erythritol 2,4-cyclodiphosphate synthase
MGTIDTAVAHDRVGRGSSALLAQHWQTGRRQSFFWRPGAQVLTGAIDRVGIGTDLHRLEPGRRLVLGHVTVDFDRGPAGHSDGDVLLHAIIDALAGAASLPDIGELFPDTDPAYRGVDSSWLLEQALKLVADRGFTPVNVDATIHLERPRLGPYKAAIRSEVALLLSLPPDSVSIKAKTNEGVDAIGRGEAIACTAVVGLRSVQ